MTSKIRTLSISMVALVGLTASAVAQQPGFRVETDVLTEGVPEPIQTSLTLFLDGVAYDISHDTGDITVVDPDNDRIVQLNAAQKIQTTLAISTFQKLLASARAQAGSSELALYLIGAKVVQKDSGTITVGDDILRYEATLQKPNDQQQAQAYAKNFRQFADAVKMLGSFSLSGGTPPFARLALNELISQENAIPAEIKVEAKRGDHRITLRSKLHATWMLSKSDRSRIEKIGESLASFEALTLDEYQRRTQEAARVAAAAGTVGK